VRVCDTCKKAIPIGTNDYVQVKFWGKCGDFLKKVHGDRNLDFCSLQCFDDFKVPKGATKK